MESPINILVVKITGTLVYRGFGSGSIEKNYSKFTVQPFEMLLDNEEQNTSTVHYLPNGNLCIYSCVGDEQPHSELYIVQDWKIDHVPANVPVMEAERFGQLFHSRGRNEGRVPKDLEHLFKPV